MTHPLFEKHQALLEQALEAIARRGYWTPFPEMPSPKIYGETALEEGKAAVLGLHGQRFSLEGQPGTGEWIAPERSPYGVELNVSYPVSEPESLVAAARKAQDGWQKLGPKGRVGLLLEALVRLNRRSFELAHAVMYTTGQGWMMAFQRAPACAGSRAGSSDLRLGRNAPYPRNRPVGKAPRQESADPHGKTL